MIWRKIGKERGAVFFFALFVVIVLKSFSWEQRNIVFIFFLILGALLSRRITSVISSIWLELGVIIGSIVSRLVLMLIYLLILTPVAIFYRLLKKKEDKTSTYISRKYFFSRKDLEKPW